MREELGPYDNVAVGTMLFTLVDPHPGHEVAYNRWYERDHFYAGCMIGPGWFAGKRWVATAELKDRRLGAGADASPDRHFLPDPTTGSFLATYWVEKGYDAEAIAWGSSQVRWLHDHDRMFPHRDHVHTLMYVHRWTVVRDEAHVPTALALDHPWAGLLAMTVDRAEGEDARGFSAWLADELLPSVVDGSGLALVAGFTPIPLPEGAPVTQPPNPGERERVLLLGFSDAEPDSGTAAALDEALEASGRGRLTWAGPFLPTVPGTDTHVDRLW
jgi:hypothetical protein